MFSSELVNKGKIVEASTLAGGPIGGFVVSTLRKHYGLNWWAEVEAYFKNHKYPPRPLGHSDEQRADSLDISKSLQLIDGLWPQVFSKYIRQKPNVSSVIKIINTAKHENNQSGFSDKATFESLMCLISVLEMTDKKVEATLLRQNYLDVGNKVLEIYKPSLDEIKAQHMTKATKNRQVSNQSKPTEQVTHRPQHLITPQEKLRALVMKIPTGKVTTYGWLATQIYGTTGATPAVLSMIKSLTGTSVPCHRVISSDGRPKAPEINYANTGRTQKQLLQSEGVLFSDTHTIDLGKCFSRPVIDN